MGRALAILGVLAGCVRSSSVTCSDGSVCPEDRTCIAYQDTRDPEGTTRYVCAGQDQLDACVSSGEGQTCSSATTPTGACFGGACLPIGCANGRLDPGEQCDDGNTISLDGCAQNCNSTEQCRNDVVDPELGEQCDDGNALDHDGCSSGCQIEQPSWIDQRKTPPPRERATLTFTKHDELVLVGGRFLSGFGGLGDSWLWRRTQWSVEALDAVTRRSGHAAAYDEGRDQIVMVGGVTELGASNETWIWNGHWQLSPTTTAPVRTEHAMAYDATRETIVLFGGSDDGNDNTANGDTWTWDGAAWTQLGISGPPARSDHAMAYDPVHGVIVLFGGADPTGALLGDTWVFDGTSWTMKSPATPPPARRGHAMAFDVVTQRIVLSGGTTTTNVDEVWEWNGSDWGQVASMPLPASQHAMASDGMRGLVVMPTQPTTTGVPTETWHRASTTWERVPARPPPRSDHSVAVDARRRIAVMFGGREVTSAGGAELGDTWIWNGRWTPGPTGPPARFGGDMAYDLQRDEIILFGGRGTSAQLDDTWRWKLDDTTGIGSWSELQPVTRPSPRLDHVVVYDAARATMLAIGGQCAMAVCTDMGIWDGADWTVRPLPVELQRVAATAAYDPLRKTVQLFGGRQGGQFFRDLWEWNGVDWVTYTIALTPPGRDNAALAWDPTRQRMVLVGGNVLGDTGTSAAANDAWELEWAPQPMDQPPVPIWRPIGIVGIVPTPRTNHVMVPAIEGAGVTLFGGRFGTTAFEDVFTLRWASTAASERCEGADEDGDALRGCDDPDCWTLCTPACMPDESCAPIAFGCGNDATPLCSGLETCATCPGDCACAP